MRNIKHTSHQQTSREFYNEVLKSKRKNLNSSKIEVSIIENNLNKLLQHSYSILSPLFNDEQEIQNFKQEFSAEEIDQDFDEHIQHISPQWLKQVILFLISIYQLLFPKKIKPFINKIIKKRITIILKRKQTTITNIATSTPNNTINNFFAFKPPT